MLGPFAGKPACTEIRVGRGVCGTAFSKGSALLVPDVELFPGHIACDSASRSELVLPLLVENECFGVFDLDSPEKDRFKVADQEGIALWLGALLKKIPLSQLSAKPWKTLD